MKKILFFSLFLILVFSSLFAGQIEAGVARSVATFHWEIFNSGSTAKPVTVDALKSKSGNVLAYVATFKPMGFVVVASNTNIYPIVAYSFNSKFSFSDTPQNALFQIIRKDMENLAKSSNLKTAKNNEAWTKYQSRDKTYFSSISQWPSKNTTKTNGWLETAWVENLSYNKFCPKDPSTGNRSNAGSAAITLAQLINYFHYMPNVTFQSSDSYQTLNGIDIDADASKYDFPSFSDLNRQLGVVQNKLSSNIKLGENDIATLTFACAIAVNMHFNSNGADSWTWDLLNATRNKFKFTSAKLLYADDGNFFSELQKNIKNRLPINLGFNDVFEHSVVCDGYNSNKFYHLNIGWNESSKKSITGWYHLTKENIDVISQGIMYIRNTYTAPTAAITKIALPDDIVNSSVIDDNEANEVVEKKKDIKEDILNDAIEADAPQTNMANQEKRITSYEEPPVVVKQVAPRYPRFVKKLGIEGQVWLNVEVLKNGDVGRIEILKSLNTGKNGLDQAAIKAVKKWKFEPAKNGGKPITVWVKFPLTFSLH